MMVMGDSDFGCFHMGWRMAAETEARVWMRRELDHERSDLMSSLV